MAAGGSLDDGNSFHRALFEAGPLADPAERMVVFAALDSFRQYRQTAHYHTTHRRRQNFYALPSSQWKRLADPPFSILDSLSAVDDAIDVNADLADTILRLGLASFGLTDPPIKDSPLDWHGKSKPDDITKAHSTIRQFYRDWSSEGFSSEVEPLVTVILSDLATHVPRTVHAVPSLLLPGAGLGRVLLELILAGYNATGNEISYHQLLASHFILNSTTHANQYPIYPFAHSFTNLVSRSHQLAQHTIPDLHPATAIVKSLQTGQSVGEMNMTAGDFVLSYSSADTHSTFDGVVTVFFIDTAPNLLRYIETVRNCLRPGGAWINIGPLLWHFDDRAPGPQRRATDSQTPATDDSADGDPAHVHTQGKPDTQDRGIGEPGGFELSDNEVIALIGSTGFRVEKHELLDNNGQGFGYMQDPQSMLQSRYRCSHWVARKI